MNRQSKNQIRLAIEPLLSSRSEHVRLEASRLLLAMNGVWVGDPGIQTPSKVTAQISLAKRELYDRMELKRERRKKANRRAYIRRRINELKETRETKANN